MIFILIDKKCRVDNDNKNENKNNNDNAKNN